MNSLQSKLDPHKVGLVYFGKQVKNIIGKAVRTCADNKPLYFGICQDSVIFGTKLRYRSVGVGVILKVCQITCIGPLVREEAYLVVNIGSKFT